MMLKYRKLQSLCIAPATSALYAMHHDFLGKSNPAN
jgi:hypothetical protein